MITVFGLRLPDSTMSSRRSSRQAPALRREITSVGQPRGEKFTIRAGESPEILIAVSKTSSQIPVGADDGCVICCERYEESDEVWQAQPCKHIFHSACIGEASISLIETKPC